MLRSNSDMDSITISYIEFKDLDLMFHTEALCVCGVSQSKLPVLID